MATQEEMDRQILTIKEAISDSTFNLVQMHTRSIVRAFDGLNEKAVLKDILTAVVTNLKVDLESSEKEGG